MAHRLLELFLTPPMYYAHNHGLEDGWLLLVVWAWILLTSLGGYLAFVAVAKIIRNVPVFTAFLLRRLGVGKSEPAMIFLELTFPSNNTKSAYATEQLHRLLRDIVGYNDFRDLYAGYRWTYSLEIVATKNQGIRYVIQIPKRKLDFVRRNLYSFVPDIKIKQIKDYLPDSSNEQIVVREFKLKSDFIKPLGEHKTPEEHDPIAYFTGHMTKLSAGELIALQFVTTPVFKTTHRRAERHVRDIQYSIACNEDLGLYLNWRSLELPYASFYLLVPPIWLLAMAVRFLMSIPKLIFDPGNPAIPILQHRRYVQQSSKDPYASELSTMVKDKLDQELFEVSVRALVAASEDSAAFQRLAGISASFNTFSSGYQRIGRVRQLWPTRARAKSLGRFRERSLTPRLFSYGNIVSVSELSDLYHLPNTDMTKTEDLVKSRSRPLPAPLSIKHTDTKLDVVVGINDYGGEEQPIGMTLKQRQTHTYIIGKSGTGKTTMLTNCIYQDMVAGKGLAVLDPHGDMFQQLLAIVPEERKKDVVVFDPSDREWPVGLNLLDPGIPFKNDDDRNEWITSSVLSVFEKLADEKQWGPRMEHVLRNTTLTALQLPNPSLYTLQQLLTDKSYQKKIAKTLKDPVLKQFWDKEFKMMGSMQMSTVTAPLTHRLGHFITSKMSRHILLQEKSTIRIADIMNEGKILLVNLSKGDIGEDQSFFFGTILTSFIWMAAYQRTKIPEKQRRDFFVYVDEFQNFATPQFADITSEARKFHVSLTVSHQNVAQIEDKKILNVMSGNANTIICFKASPADEAFILPHMKPEVEKGDIVNLAPYHFYMKTTSDESEAAFSGQTIPLEVNDAVAKSKDVIAYTRKHYATPIKSVGAQMDNLFGDPEPARQEEKNSPHKQTAATETPAEKTAKKLFKI